MMRLRFKDSEWGRIDLDACANQAMRIAFESVNCKMLAAPIDVVVHTTFRAGVRESSTWRADRASGSDLP